MTEIVDIQTTNLTLAGNIAIVYGWMHHGVIEIHDMGDCMMVYTGTKLYYVFENEKNNREHMGYNLPPHSKHVMSDSVLFILLSNGTGRWYSISETHEIDFVRCTLNTDLKICAVKDDVYFLHEKTSKISLNYFIDNNTLIFTDDDNTGSDVDVIIKPDQYEFKKPIKHAYQSGWKYYVSLIDGEVFVIHTSIIDDDLTIDSVTKMFMGLGLTDDVFVALNLVILTGFEIIDSRATRKNVIMTDEAHVNLPRKKIHKVTNSHIVFCDGNIYNFNGRQFGAYIWKGFGMFDEIPKLPDVKFKFSAWY